MSTFRLTLTGIILCASVSIALAQNHVISLDGMLLSKNLKYCTFPSRDLSHIYQSVTPTDVAVLAY